MFIEFLSRDSSLRRNDIENNRFGIWRCTEPVEVNLKIWNFL
jgi:hypothetical protein